MLQGKTAIITGGSGGIGAAAAEKLASLGVNVAVIYSRGSEKAEAVCKNCVEKYGVKAESYGCQVEISDEVKKTVTQIKKDFGGVDILVNSAGITRDGLILTMKEKDFDDVIDVNLKGTFNFIKHCAKIFMRNKYGRIINITSVSGMIGNPGQANYSSSKAAVIGLTKSAAKELASLGVTCNAVAPGFISTEMTKELEENGEVISQIPLGRFGKAEEIAEAIAFLAKSDYITGEILRVDGGIAI